MALQFFSAGFFNPQLADQALQCLEMMDFERKDFVMQRIAKNAARAVAGMPPAAHPRFTESAVTRKARQAVAEGGMV